MVFHFIRADVQSGGQGAFMAVKRYQIFVDGKFVDAHSQKTFEAINPANREVLGIFANADDADVDRAVRAARAAFDSGAWPGKTHQERGHILIALAEKIRSRASELAHLECLNSGKPIVE